MGEGQGKVLGVGTLKLGVPAELPGLRGLRKEVLSPETSAVLDNTL